MATAAPRCFLSVTVATPREGVDLDAIRPHNTKRSYANDWTLWEEFHDWLAERVDEVLGKAAA